MAEVDIFKNRDALYKEARFYAMKRVPEDSDEVTQRIVINWFEAYKKHGILSKKYRAEIAKNCINGYFRELQQERTLVCTLGGRARKPNYETCKIKDKASSCKVCVYRAWVDKNSRETQGTQDSKDSREPKNYFSTFELADTSQNLQLDAEASEIASIFSPAMAKIASKLHRGEDETPSDYQTLWRYRELHDIKRQNQKVVKRLSSEYDLSHSDTNKTWHDIRRAKQRCKNECRRFESLTQTCRLHRTPTLDCSEFTTQI